MTSHKANLGRDFKKTYLTIKRIESMLSRISEETSAALYQQIEQSYQSSLRRLKRLQISQLNWIINLPGALVPCREQPLNSTQTLTTRSSYQNNNTGLDTILGNSYDPWHISH